jgi:betaine-aldehyde dehydrogenase
MIGAKLGAALSVGNTCVIKPPSVDSMAALKLGELIEEVGFPPGTVNIITGPGHLVGNALASHPGIDMISFTGSCDTGKSIMAAASQTVKRLTLELGGKNPFIVLEDADLEMAVQKGVRSSYANSGMICASPGRYYIPEKYYTEFVDRFVELSKKWIVGDPKDEKTMMGPLVSAEHRDSVESYIRIGQDQGAKLALGGQRPTQAPMDRGFFVTPTIFTDVTQEMQIAREEIFGPVACMLRYSSEEEVLALANDNAFGLSASVWTRDVTKAVRFANDLQVGAVWINDHLTIAPEMPWGGFKESGIGKENSLVGLKEYTQLKLIAVNLS